MPGDGEHAYRGMSAEPNFPPHDGLPPGDTRYRGQCACKIDLGWRTSKELAWGDLALHLMAEITALIERGWEEGKWRKEEGSGEG